VALGAYYASSFGITFGSAGTALVAAAAGGSGPFANPPSNSTALAITNGTIRMSIRDGLTDMQFSYTSDADVRTQLFGASGNVVSSALLSKICEGQGSPGCFQDWSVAGLEPFEPATLLTFETTGRLFVDDMVIETIVPPPTSPPTKNPTSAPTKSPTSPPTTMPTQNPTTAPTMPPTNLPTNAPTRSPTANPTKAPVALCNGNTYVVYNNIGTRSSSIGALANNSVTCLVHPYSIEVRPCAGAVVPSLPVSIHLVRASDGRVVHRHRDNGRAPYYLFGRNAASGSVRPSPGPLPDGPYRLSSSVGGGTVAFTQSCPCPKGTKGMMKGCMKKRKKTKKM
jgi:cell division septation protein DedD